MEELRPTLPFSPPEAMTVADGEIMKMREKIGPWGPRTCDSRTRTLRSSAPWGAGVTGNHRGEAPSSPCFSNERWQYTMGRDQVAHFVSVEVEPTVSFFVFDHVSLRTLSQRDRVVTHIGLVGIGLPARRVSIDETRATLRVTNPTTDDRRTSVLGVVEGAPSHPPFPLLYHTAPARPPPAPSPPTGAIVGESHAEAEYGAGPCPLISGS